MIFHSKAVVRKHAEGICQHRFFEQTHGKNIETCSKVFRIEIPSFPIFELRDHLAVQHNGARHQLGEEQHEQGIVPQLLHLFLTLIHRHQERQLLEGKEADTQRQHDPLQHKICACHQVDVLDEEIVILIVTDQRHIEQNTQG